jgi:hypothetical protein
MEAVFKSIFTFFAGSLTRGVASDPDDRRNMAGLPFWLQLQFHRFEMSGY